jgi:hypothetical protein
MTKVLEKQPHAFPVVNEVIQILASHTTELYQLLKVHALQLAQIAVSVSPPKRVTATDEQDRNFTDKVDVG